MFSFLQKWPDGWYVTPRGVNVISDDGLCIRGVQLADDATPDLIDRARRVLTELFGSAKPVELARIDAAFGAFAHVR